MWVFGLGEVGGRLVCQVFFQVLLEVFDGQQLFTSLFVRQPALSEREFDRAANKLESTKQEVALIGRQFNLCHFSHGTAPACQFEGIAAASGGLVYLFDSDR